jgi:hypothetical protein
MWRSRRAEGKDEVGNGDTLHLYLVTHDGNTTKRRRITFHTFKRALARELKFHYILLRLYGPDALSQALVVQTTQVLAKEFSQPSVGKIGLI